MTRLFSLLTTIILAGFQPPKISNTYDDPSDLGVGQEIIPKDEAEKLAQYAKKFLLIHKKQQFKNSENLGSKSTVWRGMHARGHGCFVGQLQATIESDEFLQGIFQKDMTYPIVARFSNGSGSLKNDRKRDLRGFAIKVKSIEGKPLLGSAKNQSEQDFLMTNAPRHHAKDIDQLMEFIEAMSENALNKAAFFLKYPAVLTTLLGQTSRKVDSLLTESYWSRSPITWGHDLVVKYLAEPCYANLTNQISTKGGGSDLSSQIKAQMRHSGACFWLKVQKQVNPSTEPIENHRTAWKTAEHTVAKIMFPQQEADLGKSCEALTFNPWNGILEHRPLGNFNRARKYIYEVSQSYRRTSN